VNELGVRIISGRLRPGATLDLPALETELGVSRTVVRESLRVLTTKGLVAARQKRGTYVTEPTRWNTLDPDVLRWRLSDEPSTGLLDRLIEIRLIIEPGVAALAARRRDDDDLAAMASALDRMAAHADDPASVADHDVDFHRAILQASHNDLVTSLGTVIDQGIRQTYLLGSRSGDDGSVPVRRAILDAITDRDADRATERMRRLIESDRREA
jgi:DNA-binding FadR family transcriptional regulator